MSFKEKIAKRAAAEIKAGQIVNLGVGIPTLISKYIDPDKAVSIQSENGILGMGLPRIRGSEDRNLIDAGGRYVSIKPGGSFFDSAISFMLIRGGRLDISFLGALEISAAGDLANWTIPGRYSPGIGGGMELAQKARRLIVTTRHTNREGKSKIREDCSLPITAKGCVDRIITELAVIDVSPVGLKLREIAVETDVDTVIARTEAKLTVPREHIPRF